ncbi:hypothetical protein WSK_1985 [Novosphingobium sp. Rr 2-17]|uniref:hypothetical protein n=1 Tax=Novosphingobium sp. Rr 2-17 TaxID=555793 RepID=UPI00026984FE|nr:hypothetical protein [Novosphingobium sp. Rr 2-17]EIZ79432.1 hypothetical protein WSK_1985 [Novosphingobium sp. Rr 2-17]
MLDATFNAACPNRLLVDMVVPPRAALTRESFNALSYDTPETIKPFRYVYTQEAQKKLATASFAVDEETVGRLKKSVTFDGTG